eukprot:TRINITY_DN17067_c0_g1_i1.p1 TRINITY_DN17067_c0_g1~~TRINITY_DN17067_c0_g1_i1.p1  ORF type:complete len:692 (+),score=118.83 TRINITY_DN17067_c0_g1_i1:198-2273(+)
MDSARRHEDAFSQISGVITGVEALVGVLDTHIAQISDPTIPMEAVREPAQELKTVLMRLKEGVRGAQSTLTARAASPQADETARPVNGEDHGIVKAASAIPGSVRSETASVDKFGQTDKSAISDGHWTQPVRMDDETPGDSTSLQVQESRISRTLKPKKVEAEKGLFYPSWTGKLTWDLFVMLIVVCDAMVLPFQLSFKHGMDDDSFDVLWFWVTLLVFTADLIATFNTALQDDENDVSGKASFIADRKQIAIIYLKGWFTIDFVSTFPWSKIAESLSDGEGGAMTHLTKLLKMLKFARIIRLMKMLRARKIKDIWEKVEVAIGSVVIVQCMMLLRVLLVVVAICHWFACIFWIVGSPVSLVTELLPAGVQADFRALPHWTTLVRTFGPQNNITWRWIDRPLTEKYIFCFYWTLGVMRTMPAEVTPVNLPERIFVLLFMFFALSAFAISVASLTQAYFKINERSRSFGDEMFFIRMHLSKMKMDRAAQRRIKDYLGHLFERRRILAKEANLLDKMPDVLKKEVFSAKINLQLRKLTILPELSQGTIRELCEQAETFDLMPDQTICKAGENAEAAWIIVKGVVQARDASGELLDLDEPLDVIDEECLYAEEVIASELTVVTMTCCEVVKIDRALFTKIVSSEQSWATRRYTSRSQEMDRRPTGPQQIEVQEATDNQREENGAASAAAAALSA